MKTHNFRELKIWKSALTLTKEVYLITGELPSDEKFGLKSQINRSAVSVPSNIAEGSGRTTNKEFKYFLNVALASSYELETQLILVENIFNLSTKKTIKNLTELQKMIGGFKRLLSEQT